MINPPSDWLQNANDPPWQVTLPRAIDRADYAPYGQVATLTVGTFTAEASGGPADPLGIFNALPFPFGLWYMAFEDNPGDSWIAAVEFGETANARVLLSYGNATQPGSPLHGDQLPFLVKGEMRPAWRTRAEIEANLEAREVVGPAATST